ncbi:hypothetical protein [Pontibacter pudoricolor]|uniref:hypothetical protein n=1 Tax=Pontibacter pudoricolor TaxID=2694930 RepID=UPI001391CDFA|nr:hypothetical protein [Pontibacter pudoricolor]
MKALLLLLALLLCIYLARIKTRSARSLMSPRNYPEMLVHPYQHATNPVPAVLTV